MSSMSAHYLTHILPASNFCVYPQQTHAGSFSQQSLHNLENSKMSEQQQAGEQLHFENEG